MCNITKRLKTPDKVERYFPAGFLAFIVSTSEQQIPRPVNTKRKKEYYSGKKKKHTAVKTQLMVNNHGYIIHKTNHKRGCRRDYNIYKNNHPLSLPNKLLMSLI